MSNVVAANPPGRVTNAGLWLLQAALAFAFAGAGYLKLSGAPAMTEMFGQIGAGQWLRYLVGALEIAGAVGLLHPRLSGLAALGLGGLMAGAAVTNQFVLAKSPWLPVGLLVVAVVIARGRWRRTRVLVSRAWQGARG